MIVSKTEVQRAVRNLEERVGSGHARQQSTRSVLSHMRYCLFELSSNVYALSTALEVFSLHAWPDLRRALSKSKPSSSRKGGSDVNSIRSRALGATLPAATTTEDLLQHAFAALLRMHDGLILITSGECRHKADMEHALRPNNPYPSRLAASSSVVGANTSNSRGDGYTRLYKSEHVYNGASWDEWNDPDNGLRRRLVRAAGQPWSALIRRAGSGSGPTAEDLVNRIETEIRRLEDDFRALRERVERGLVPPLREALGCAAVTVRLSFACKLERLEVRAPAARYRLDCQRLGQEFQLRDRVLPSATRDEWERILQFPMPATAEAADPVPERPDPKPPRKKRRVLEDSEDENDDKVGKEDELAKRELESTNLPVSDAESGSLAKPSATGPGPSASAMASAEAAASFTGLIVQQRVDAPRPELSSSTRGSPRADAAASEDTELLQASVHEIKAALGINVQALEASHQVLQDEEAEASREAQAIDEEADGEDTIQENWTLQYRKLNKQLERALRNPSVDDDTLWELRDCVRQAAMAAGNQCLWRSHPGDANIGAEQRRADLEEALFFFGTAQQLVQDQHDLHQLMTAKIDSTHGSSFSDAALLFQRNLHLLHAQAHINAGIARVELYRCVRRRSSWAKKARQQFDRAERCLDIVPTLKPQSYDPSSVDMLLDQLKAQELRLLSMRWRGMLLWSKGDRLKALDALQAAADADVAAPVQEFQDQLEYREAVLKVWAESYRAGVTVADLVVGALEEASVAQIRQELTHLDKMLQQAGVAIESAGRKSRSLHASVEKQDSSLFSGRDSLEELSILTEVELQQSLRESQEWWQRKVAVAMQAIEPSSREVSAGRNDLSVEFPFDSDDDDGNNKTNKQEAAAPLRFVVYGSAPFPYKPRRKRIHFGGGRGSNIRPTAVQRDRQTPPPKPRKYRRWGDELLPQVQDENGNWVPKLSYPAIAPDMPPDIKARLETLQLSRNGPSPR